MAECCPSTGLQLNFISKFLCGSSAPSPPPSSPNEEDRANSAFDAETFRGVCLLFEWKSEKKPREFGIFLYYQDFVTRFGFLIVHSNAVTGCRCNAKENK